MSCLETASIRFAIFILLLKSISTQAFLTPHYSAAIFSCPPLFASAEVSEMRLGEIQGELKELGVSYTDCFDRESLTKRLLEARENPPIPSAAADGDEDVAPTTPAQDSTNPSPTSSSFDKEAVLEELRSLRVAQLRTECGMRNIRWGSFVEKEDLVQALLNAREQASNFSISGAIVPGEVSTLTDEELDLELKGEAGTPLLLDVYATWCGPCQIMAGELVKAAEELGDAVRLAKIDSDQYPEWSRRLRVEAFPTVVLFGKDGKEIKRMEGALMKDQIIDWVET